MSHQRVTVTRRSGTTGEDYPHDMNTVDFINLVLVLIVIIVLAKFSTQLHKTTQQMRAMVARDAENVERLEATINRMEAATVVVAHNLADSVSRANATVGPDGAAADAALRTEDVVS